MKFAPRRVFYAGLLVTVVFLFPNIVRADSYDWVYSGSFNFGSGELTTDAYGLITSVTGTFNGQPAGLLAPNFAYTITNDGLTFYDEDFGNDNLLFPTGPQVIDSSGFAITGGYSPYWDIRWDPTTGYYASLPSSLYRFGDEGTFSIAQTPEPSIMKLLLTTILASTLLYGSRLQRASRT